MYWYLLSIWPSTYKIHIVLKSVLCTNLYLEEHMWKIAKAVSFLKFNVASNIIVSIGVYRVWVHTCTISYSIESLLNTADVDGGLCTATITLKCPPPPHPHSPNYIQTLIFGFRKWKTLIIWPLVFQLYPTTPLVHLESLVIFFLFYHISKTSRYWGYLKLTWAAWEEIQAAPRKLQVLYKFDDLLLGPYLYK